ncbi:MAG: hypothetical protein Q8N53_18265 [Longimicrobiales bacterium]|nr:hypothetical protein [Longimicrobiales bacterium]
MARVGRGLVLGLVAAALLQALPRAQSREDHPVGAESVARVVGGGRLEMALCLGCGMAVVASAGASWGGLLLTAIFHPEAVASCAYMCVAAVRAT